MCSPATKTQKKKITELVEILMFSMVYKKLIIHPSLQPYRIIGLCGSPGSGKSFIMAHLTALLTSAKDTYIHVDDSNMLDNKETVSTPDYVNGLRHLISRYSHYYEIRNVEKKKVDTTTSLQSIFDRLISNYKSLGRSSFIICDFIIENKQTLELIQSYCGTESYNGIVVLLATTRKLSDLFEKRVCHGEDLYVESPNYDDRFIIMNNLIPQKSRDISDDELSLIASKCQAFLPRDLVELCSLSLQNAFLRMKTYPSDYKYSIKINEKDILKAKEQIKPFDLRDTALTVPCVYWKDIGGYEDVKTQLKECVEWPIKYQKIFLRLEMTPPKGVLLFGPPGCSKTLMAKAIATEAYMNFIAIKGPEVFSKWLGDSEKAIRELFVKARVNSPCVLFFDEIDSIAVSRDLSCRDGGAEDRVLCQLLNEMDGIQSNGEVIVIGATNRPRVIDPAIMRPGRIDRIVYVPLPDIESRKKIIQLHLKNLVSFDDDNTKETDKNLTRLEKENLNYLYLATEGYSGAEIAMLCKEAIMLSMREYLNNVNSEKKQDYPTLKWDHMKKMLEKIIPRTSSKMVEDYEDFARSIMA